MLICWKLDRLDRKLGAFQMIADVIAAGGRIEFVTQTALNDLSTMAGRISLKIAEEMAYEESQTKSDRVRIKQASLKAKNSVCGPAGWGLQIVPDGSGGKTLTPTPDGMKYATEIFERVAANQSLADVARFLTASGVLTATGKTEWSAQTVGQIVRCRSMMGRRSDASGKTDLKFTALVPVTLWDAANAALSTRSHRGPMNLASKSLLSGVMKCALCGSPMYLIKPQYTKSPGAAMYRCAGRGAVRKSGCKNLVPVAYADGIVNAKMSADDTEIRELRPATDGELKLALDDVETDLRQLPSQGFDYVKEDAERSNLRAEKTRLLGLIADAKVAGPALVGIGQTYAQLWASLATDGARNRWLADAGATVIGLRGDDGKVKVTCDRKLAALFWTEEDGQAVQYEEIPPVVDGNWVFVAPGYKHRMHRARPRS